jgi:hypothetical protein
MPSNNNNLPAGRAPSHLLYLTRILGRRAFIAFAAVTLVVVFLLSAIQIASRYALKQYVEDQLTRVSWDISVYQPSDLALAEQTRQQIAAIPHIVETQNIFFLRTSVPPTTVAYIDQQPMRSPWLSMLSVTDTRMLPTEIRPAPGKAILVLVGSKAQMGDAFLQLQNKKLFELRVNLKHHGALAGRTGREHDIEKTVFDVPLERTVRMDRNDVNRWFMDQTSSPTLVPELGVILVTAYNPKILNAFDAVSRGVANHFDGDDGDEGQADHEHDMTAGQYLPDIIHLARMDRLALVSGWDVEASYKRIADLGRKVYQEAHLINSQVGTDNTSGVLLERMSKTAKAVALISLLAALPLVWMAWVLLANLSSLLLLNERRKFGLLRLRGVSGKSLGQAMQIAIGAGGLVGGVLGAVLGTVLPILFYARGWLPWETIVKIQNPLILAVSLLIGVALSLLTSRRLVRYAANISPLEASGRVAGSEASASTVRFGWLQSLILLLGTLKVLSWIFNWSFATEASPAWISTIERGLDFVAFPFFVYGVTSLLVSRRRWLTALLRPAALLFGGRLRQVSLQHMSMRPHRIAGLLLIVAMMASISLYPTVMTAVFDNKIERAAEVQLGSPLQVSINIPDLVPAAALSKDGMRERYALVREQSQALLAKLKALKQVKSAGFLVEGLVDGLYMPGQGFNSIPIYLVDDPKTYLTDFYHEDALGQSDAFAPLIGRLGDSQLLLSTAMTKFWQRPLGAAMPVGRDTKGSMLTAPVGGTLHFMAGIPLTTVQDRDSFVGERVDYLNYLFNNRSYVVASANDPKLATLDVLMQRLVLTIEPNSGVSPAELKQAVLAALPSEPMQVRELDEEVARLGSDMYIFLARQNVQIYLFGGVLMALIGILAMAFTNYVEDRRTLGLLRIRGCGPREIFQFLSAGLSAPAAVGLIFGALIALLVGYGITNLIWKLHDLKTIMIYLHTHLMVSWQTVTVGGLLILIVLAIVLFFSRWIFKRSARESLSDY